MKRDPSPPRIEGNRFVDCGEPRIKTVPDTGPQRPVMLTDRERRVLAAALELQAAFLERIDQPSEFHERLRERLLRGVKDTPQAEMTRPQELAADAMNARYGRCHWRAQGDGSVVITGLLDDIEQERVCVERDGTERWRER